MSNRERPTHLPESVDVVSLRLLSDALRKEMPENFGWDYSLVLVEDDCGSVGCAIGLASIMGMGDVEKLERGLFGIPEKIGKAIFFSNCTYNKYFDEVTPTDVADAIDYYLDHGRLP